MPSTAIHHDDHGYLRQSRASVLRSVAGVGEYELRRPMTPTGTNLLGVVKHLIGIEAGYLGFCLGHPFPRRLPRLDDDERHADMWATADESSAGLIEQYGEACAHSDAVLTRVGMDAPAEVPWWPSGSRSTTAGALLARVLTDTAMHAGQLQIIRELIDGQGGSDRSDAGDETWWRDHVARLEALARSFEEA